MRTEKTQSGTRTETSSRALKRAKSALALILVLLLSVSLFGCADLIAFLKGDLQMGEAGDSDDAEETSQTSDKGSSDDAGDSGAEDPSGENPSGEGNGSADGSFDSDSALPDDPTDSGDASAGETSEDDLPDDAGRPVLWENCRNLLVRVGNSGAGAGDGEKSGGEFLLMQLDMDGGRMKVLRLPDDGEYGDGEKSLSARYAEHYAAAAAENAGKTPKQQEKKAVAAGMEAVEAAVGEAWGLQFDHYVSMSESALVKLANALGVDIPEPPLDADALDRLFSQFGKDMTLADAAQIAGAVFGYDGFITDFSMVEFVLFAKQLYEVGMNEVVIE